MKLSDFGPINPFKKSMGGLFGDEGANEQLSLATPEQQSALQQYFANPLQNNQLYQSGSSYLQNLLGNNNPNAMAEFNAPYMQQFQQQIIPGLSERFAGMGTGAGALNSSAFNQTLAQAGSGLQSTLAQLRQQLLGQASQQALGYAQQPYSNLLGGLGVRQFENVYKPPTTGFGQKLIGGGIGGLAGFALGGPAGALMGAASGFGGS